MKHILLFILIVFLATAAGCNRHGTYSQKILSQAEQVAQSHPDSAYALIQALERDTLGDENFARWCMLYGKLSYRIPLAPLPVFDWQDAVTWYGKHGTPENQSHAKLFLGEAYAHENQPDSAIKAYTDAFTLAGRHQDYNLMGYACSHMGSLYESQNYLPASMEKFRQASEYFHKAQNYRSQACALRDLCRQYAYADSIPKAFQIIRQADSITSTLHDNEMYSSILNTYGNIYLLCEAYEQAEDCFWHAIRLSKDTLPDYIALCDLYLTMGNTEKAKAIINKISAKDWEKASIEKHYLSYEIAKQKRQTDKALQHLEQLTNIKDSLIIIENNAHIAELEKRYTIIKLKNENANLKIRQQQYLIISISLGMLFLCLFLIYYTQKKKSEKQIIRQQTELNRLKAQAQTLSREIEEKKALLEDSKKKNIQQAERLQIEIDLLNEKHLQLKRDFLTRSDICKKLSKLACQRPAIDGKPLLTKALWKQLVQEVTELYPGFKSYVLEHYPDISEAEWNYCCFCLLGFDGNDSAKLLGIAPNSIYTKTFRLRQKLNITLPPQTSLSDYLIRQLN